MLLRAAALLLSAACAFETAAPGLGITRLPEPPAIWHQALRGAGIPFVNSSADAALIWGLQGAGVQLSQWQKIPDQREVWVGEAKARLADKVKLDAAAAAKAAQNLPEAGVKPQQLFAVRDDLRYLVKAYGPNVPSAARSLQSLYAGAELAAQKGEAAALKNSALAIADSLMQGLAKADESVSVAGTSDGAAKRIALSAAPKKWTFEARAKAIKQVLLFKVATGPRSKSRVDPRHETVDGIPAQLLDDDGRSNSGVYRYSREGKRRIMKVTRHELNYPYPEDEPEEDIDSQVRGGAIGSLFGAAKITRTGVADLGYHSYYFIEMEEEFPNENPRSFKSAARARDAKFMALMGRPRADGRAPAAEIADKLVEVLEYGVVPYDGDFLETPDGRLEWVDTNFWVVDTNTSFPAHKVKVLREAHYFLVRLGIDRDAGRAYAMEFLKQLRASTRLSASIKEEILKDWIENAPELLKELGLPTDYAALRVLPDASARRQ